MGLAQTVAPPSISPSDNRSYRHQLLIPKYKALQLKLEHAATVVSQASAEGSKQKQGQKDRVGGVRELAQGIGLLDTALKDAVDGKAAAAKTELVKAQKALNDGNALGTEGAGRWISSSDGWSAVGRLTGSRSINSERNGLRPAQAGCRSGAIG